MKLKSIEEIRDKDEYNGFRVSLDAKMENARIPIKVDITIGDEITPKEVVYTFDLLLKDRSIDILAYNIETVIADKLEGILAEWWKLTTLLGKHGHKAKIDLKEAKILNAAN